MGRIYLDPDSNVVAECYAVIYAPQRKRGRFPTDCVFVKDSEEEAMAAADPAKNIHAARVMGPSRSSEGFMLYYIVEWLDGEREK